MRNNQRYQLSGARRLRYLARMTATTPTLRPLNPARDAEALHAIFGDEESCRYLPDSAFASIEETRAQLEAWGVGAEDTSWAVVDNVDGPALGRLSLFTGRDGVWEAACMIVPAARGRGLTAALMPQALDHVFEQKGARRIFADIDPEHAASLRTFEKLGFKKEGVLRALWKTHIGVRDSVIMGLIDSDPRPWR